MTRADKRKIVQDMLKRGHIQEIITDEKMPDFLLEGPKRVKWGTDPTSTHIHLGRSVPIMILRDLQQLGHQIVVIIGNFTAEVGDTSDKNSERPVLSSEQVRINMETYVDQIGLLLDLDKTEFCFNRDWWDKINFSEFVRLTDLFSLAEFSNRSIIANRLNAGRRVSLKEMIYPVMQGYDSLAMNADIEIGGTDQRFNLLAGRVIQRAHNKPAQTLLMSNLIDGLDNRKMSSSWGNTVNLTDVPSDMFGKIMSMRDEMIESYFIHLTRRPLGEIQRLMDDMKKGELNPRDVKLDLSYEIVSTIHGREGADNAALHFQQVIQKKKQPKEIPSFTVATRTITGVLVEVGFADSNSQARRLINQGGVEVDGIKIRDIHFDVPSKFILKKGKRHYANVYVI
jgi:tyrosyl-tRNA synthetase